MKTLMVLVTLAAFGLVLSDCGGSNTGRGSRAASDAAAPTGGAVVATLPQIEVKGDAENDSDSYGPPEEDNENGQLGQPASAADAQAIAAVVKRYYATAARDDGASACKLLYSSMVESVVEDYGRPPAGPPNLRGNTCAVVLSKFFALMHSLLRAESATLRVIAVRVDLNRGSAQFEAAKSNRYILMHRERGAWKINMLLGMRQRVGVE